MLQFWNKLNNWMKFSTLLCAILMVSCGFIDLRPIGVVIEPDKTDTVLPGPFSPVILKFDTAMEKDDTEGIMQITSDFGSVRGDKFWKGNELYFVPVQGWTAGVRYTLSLLGTLRSVDGRDTRLEKYISFYAINKNTPPYLVRYNPLNGESTRTNNVIPEFYFSRSMDRLTVESALNIEGIGGKTFEWLDNDRVLKVVPDKALSPWILYRWSIRDSAKSKDGVPLSGSYSGFFTTDLDYTLPIVTNVYPVLFTDGCWYPTGTNMESGLRSGQGIAVSFNKSMGENALRSIRFEPSLTGRSEFLTDDSIVYIFTRDPEPETTYTLIVSGDTKDSEGLKIGSDYKLNFSIDIPFLKVLSITFNDNLIIDNFAFINNALPVTIDSATGKLILSIHFSLVFGLEEKLNTPQRIVLTPFFPRTIPPVALQYLSWISGDRLYMTWEGLTEGDEISHYYKLLIPGGKGGISCGSGVLMNEDIILYLEAVK